LTYARIKLKILRSDFQVMEGINFVEIMDFADDYWIILDKRD